MGKRMSVLIILSCKSLNVVVACLNRTFLWSLVLMGEHMSLEIFENLSAFWVCAASLLPRFLAAEVILAAVRVVRYDGWSSGWWIWI